MTKNFEVGVSEPYLTLPHHALPLQAYWWLIILTIGKFRMFCLLSVTSAVSVSKSILANQRGIFFRKTWAVQMSSICYCVNYWLFFSQATPTLLIFTIESSRLLLRRLKPCQEVRKLYFTTKYPLVAKSQICFSFFFLMFEKKSPK